MRRLGVAGLVTALVTALSAAGASAAPHLILSENGAPVAVGDYALDFHLEFDGGCLQASKGEVLSNGRPSDKLAFGPPEESECLEEGYAVAGALKQVVLTGAGKATMTFSPPFAITEPGPCVYRFKKLTGEFPATIEVAIEGTALGKLRASLSSHACAQTRSIEFKAVESGIDNDIFGAEVIP